MRIGVDARFLTHPQPGGFKRYTENLLRVLTCTATDNEYFLYVDRPFPPDSPCPLAPHVTVRVLDGTRPLIGMLWREQVLLARQARRDRLGLLHSPCLTAPLRLPCPSVVTVHDTFSAFPDDARRAAAPATRQRALQTYYRFVSRQATRQASAVITPSNVVRDAVRARFGLPADRITVTPEAPAPIFRPVTDEARLAAVRNRYNLPPDYVLAIASIDPRKNVHLLVRAHASLPSELRAQHPLVVVLTDPPNGGHPFADVAEVRLVPRVTDDELCCLYSAAVLFAFPSSAEGFGLPMLEAMACGAPVLAADAGALPEVAGSAAELVVPDPTALAQALSRLLANADSRADLRRRGLARAAEFSWERCAEATRAVYERVQRDRQ